MRQCETYLHTNSTLLLYAKNTGDYDLTMYESIMNQDDQRVQITQNQIMRNTLEKIKKSNLMRKNDEQLEREKEQSFENDVTIVESSDDQQQSINEKEIEKEQSFEYEDADAFFESSDVQQQNMNEIENADAFFVPSNDHQQSISEKEIEKEQSFENYVTIVESSDEQQQNANGEEQINSNQSKEKYQYISNRPLSLSDEYMPDISSSDENLNCSFSKEKSYSEFKSTNSEPRNTLHTKKRSESSLSQFPVEKTVHSTPRLNQNHHISLSSNSQLNITQNINNYQGNTNNGEESKVTLKVGRFQHCDLQRETVDVETIDDNLSGIVYINRGDYVNNPPKQIKNKYEILRKLFKSTGYLLKTLQYTDQGHINADKVRNCLHIQNEDDDGIKAKGEELYHILNAFYELKSKLNPILIWYKQKYGSKIIPSIDDNLIIDDDLGMILNLSDTEPEKDDISFHSFYTLLDKVMEIVSDDDYNDPDYDSNLPLTKVPLRSIFSCGEMSDISDKADAEVSFVFDNGEKYTSVHLYNKPDPNTKVCSYLSHTLYVMQDIRRYHDFVPKDRDESEISIEEDMEDEDESIDDNNVPIRLYDWKHRSESLIVDEILEVIKEVNAPNYQNDEDVGFLMNIGLSQLWERIQHDVVQLYVTMKPRYIKPFVKDFIDSNNVEHPPNIHVRAYRKLKEMKANLKKKMIKKKNLCKK